MAGNFGKAFLTGFLESSQAEFEKSEEREYEQLQEARKRRDIMYAEGHKLNMANQAEQKKFLTMAEQGGSAYESAIAAEMIPKGLPEKQKAEWMAKKSAQWADDKQSLVRDIKSKFPIDPTVAEYDNGSYADSDHFEAKRKAFEGWGFAKMFGLEPSPAKLRKVAKRVSMMEGEAPIGEVGTIAMPISTIDKRTRAGYYKNIKTEEEVQGTIGADGNVMITDPAGKPMSLTAEWVPVSLTEGIGQGGRVPTTKTVTASQVEQYAPQILQMIANTPYELRSGKTGETAMVDAALQAWNDLTFQNRMSGTAASRYLHSLLQETKEGEPKWGRFEKNNLFYNDFDVPTFREVIDTKLSELNIEATTRVGQPPVMTAEQVRAAPSGTAFTTTDGRRGVKP